LFIPLSDALWLCVLKLSHMSFWHCLLMLFTWKTNVKGEKCSGYRILKIQCC
jgi:hypothetical protein